jgi:hypothetical protein
MMSGFMKLESGAMNAGLRPASKVSLGRRLSDRGFIARKSGNRFWVGLTLKPIFGVTFP